MRRHYRNHTGVAFHEASDIRINSPGRLSMSDASSDSSSSFLSLTSPQPVYLGGTPSKPVYIHHASHQTSRRRSDSSSSIAASSSKSSKSLASPISVDSDDEMDPSFHGGPVTGSAYNFWKRKRARYEHHPNSQTHLHPHLFLSPAPQWTSSSVIPSVSGTHASHPMLSSPSLMQYPYSFTRGHI